MHWKDLIVQLHVPVGGKARIGTGYPVAKGVLLTAAHVVGDDDGNGVRARWWHHGDEKAVAMCQKILWDGRTLESPCDVVLLACEFPDAVSSNWGTVGAVKPQDHGKWASEGFAFVGDHHKKPVPLMGKTHSMGSGSKKFYLQVDASAETKEDWAGASGSPVMVKGCVIGVIVTCPGSFNAERIAAVPMFRLLADPEFRTLVEYSEMEDQRTQLRDGAVRALARPGEAIDLLSNRLKVKSVENRTVWAEATVDKLIELANAVVIAGHIVACQKVIAHQRETPDLSMGCLKEVAMYAIPAALATDRVRQIEIISNDDRFLFDASTADFVEMGMARLHGRPATFRNPDNQKSKARAVLRLEAPAEPEIDRDGQKFKRLFMQSLWEGMVLDERTDFSVVPIDELVEELNDELENRADVADPLHYYVFELPSNEDVRNRRINLVEELNELFPRIVFVGVEVNVRDSEVRRTMRHVVRILCNAAGIEWKQYDKD